MPSFPASSRSPVDVGREHPHWSVERDRLRGVRNARQTERRFPADLTGRAAHDLGAPVPPRVRFRAGILVVLENLAISAGTVLFLLAAVLVLSVRYGHVNPATADGTETLVSFVSRRGEHHRTRRRRSRVCDRNEVHHLGIRGHDRTDGRRRCALPGLVAGPRLSGRASPVGWLVASGYEGRSPRHPSSSHRAGCHGCHRPG